MNQGVLFQVVEKREYVKNGDSFQDCAVYDVYGVTQLFNIAMFIVVKQGSLNFSHLPAEGCLIYNSGSSPN